MTQTLDAVVVGAGQAGLGVAYFLKRDGYRFVVLERGRVGETWRSQRWDAFALNTPNWCNVLPGETYEGPEPDGFWGRDELVRSFEQYVEKHELPVRTGVSVTSVEAAPSGSGFIVTTNADEEPLEARTVVLASGAMQTPRLPPRRVQVPESVLQMHTGDYRSVEMLPPGAVVVIGAGQSGCQVAEDLLSAGRKVYLCASKVARLPRRYRGRDIIDWWAEMGFLDERTEDLEDATQVLATQPQTSGVGRHGHTVSLQQLERAGAVLRGRFVDVQNGVLITDSRLPEYIQYADEKSAAFKKAIDDYLAKKGIESPPREDDPADEPAPRGTGHGAPTRLDLEAAKVGTIIWCTGFTADYGWIKVPVLDDRGLPMHDHGVSPVPGLYFLGFPWLRSRKSGLIAGICDDAEFIAGEVRRYLA